MLEAVTAPWRPTLHGVTKPVTFAAEYGGRAKAPVRGDERIGFWTGTHINRKDFGLTWNAALETGGVAVETRRGTSRPPASMRDSAPTRVRRQGSCALLLLSPERAA